MKRLILILCIPFCFAGSLEDAINTIKVNAEYHYPGGYGVENIIYNDVYLLHKMFDSEIGSIEYYSNWQKCNNCGRTNIYNLEEYRYEIEEDRLPVQFIEDWISFFPKYKDERYDKAFHTFGWCSEFEMSFCTILRVMGYDCKVYQSDINGVGHVDTRVWLSPGWELVVDNTFRGFSTEPTKYKDLESWYKDIGEGTHNEWYNRKVKESVDAVSKLDVPIEFIWRMEITLK